MRLLMLIHILIRIRILITKPIIKLTIINTDRAQHAPLHAAGGDVAPQLQRGGGGGGGGVKRC